MKKLIHIILFFVVTAMVAQKKSNEGLALAVYIPAQTETIPSSAKKMLSNKLTQIITKNGISKNTYKSRFVIVSKVDVLSKNITATAPPKIALNLNVNFFIGDGFSGELFASESIELKGVGNNETKAYISAIKRLSSKNPKIIEFIETGKEKINQYYNNNCENFIKQIEVAESQNKFKKALKIATDIPETSTCFNVTKSKIKGLYKKVIDRDCKLKLEKASAIWTANQNLNAANQAGALLSSIEPEASCFSNIKVLYNKIDKRVKVLSDRDWEYTLKELDIEKQSIQSTRDIGVAYGNNQAQTVNYNVSKW